MEALTSSPLHELIPYAVAAGLGALVGLERQYSADRVGQEDAAGVRTHALWGVVGVLAAQLSRHPGWEYLYVVGLIATGILLGIANVLKFTTTGDRGVTTELSQLAVFLIAALVADRNYLLAVPLTVGVTVLLRAKESLHHLSGKFGAKEMNATIRFAIIAGGILPFLPNRGMGPLQAFNPQQIWLMVVLVSGVSFSGYMLLLFLGNRGIEITGFLSGLVSSTAATLQLSRQSRESRVVSPYVSAVILACTIAFPRALLLVAVAGSTELLQYISGPLLVVTAIGALLVLLVRRISKKYETLSPEPIELENPLHLGSVLSFGLLFAVIVFLTHWAQAQYQEGGVLVLSAVSGISGVSAITLSLCSLSNAHLAARGILLATAVSTAVKSVFVILWGAPVYRWWTALALFLLAAAATVAGLADFFWF